VGAKPGGGKKKRALTHGVVAVDCGHRQGGGKEGDIGLLCLAFYRAEDGEKIRRDRGLRKRADVVWTIASAPIRTEEKYRACRTEGGSRRSRSHTVALKEDRGKGKEPGLGQFLAYKNSYT